jgi:predicted dehydrogenase
MNVSRRDFVRAAGVAVGAEKLYGANDQVNLGFIGIGIQGSSHLRFFSAYPGVRPVAAADLYDGHLTAAKERTEGAIYTTKDYHELLARTDVDAVVIAAPEHWHRRMVLDALAAGKHIYCEKPLAWSIEQGAEIVSAVAKSRKLLMVGSQTKTMASTAKARQIIKSGKLGQVTMIRSGQGRNDPEGAWQYPIPPDASPATVDWQRFLGPASQRPFDAQRFFQWRSWWEYSGGLGTDLMTHTFTMLHEILDVTCPTSAVSHGGIYRWKDGREVPDVLNSILEYEPGFVVDIYVNLANAHPLHGTAIMGTEGTLLMDRQGLTFYPEPAAPKAQGYGVNGWPRGLRAQYYEALGYTADGKPKEPLPSRKEPETIPVDSAGSLRHLDHFIRSLRDGTPSRETAVDGHYAAAAGHLVNLAYRRRRRVQFDLKTGNVSDG